MLLDSIPGHWTASPVSQRVGLHRILFLTCFKRVQHFPPPPVSKFDPTIPALRLLPSVFFIFYFCQATLALLETL